MRSHRRRDFLQAALLFLLALSLNFCASALRTQQALSGKALRLHVLANSDAPEDQALKLHVRDRILAETAELLADAADRTDAETRLRAGLSDLADAAADTVRAYGYAYPVALELQYDAFPTRDYGPYALPAGTYLALRVRIGQADGQNWWCVVFPPLCGAAPESLPENFSADEIRFMTRADAPYQLKFRLVEYWDAFRQSLSAP